MKEEIECSSLGKLLYKYPVSLCLKNIGKLYSLQSTFSPSDPAPEMFIQSELFHQFLLSAGNPILSL